MNTWYDDYTIEQIQKHFLEIEAKVRELIKDNQSLRNDLLAYDLNEEIQKRDKIIQKQSKLDILGINQQGLKKYLDFRNYHYKHCHNSGHYIFDVTGTGLGNCISVICPICNEDIDISNIG